MNIAYAQVNPLCSCQSSIAVLIVGRRKLALLQSGMAFSVSSAFIFIISIIFVPISPRFPLGLTGLTIATIASTL